MKNISIKRNNMYKVVAPCRAESCTFTMISSMKNISIGSLVLDRLKPDLH